MEPRLVPRTGYHRRNTENEIELQSLNNATSETSYYQYRPKFQYNYKPVLQPEESISSNPDSIKSTSWLKVKTILEQCRWPCERRSEWWGPFFAAEIQYASSKEAPKLRCRSRGSRHVAISVRGTYLLGVVDRYEEESAVVDT